MEGLVENRRRGEHACKAGNRTGFVDFMLKFRKKILTEIFLLPARVSWTIRSPAIRLYGCKIIKRRQIQKRKLNDFSSGVIKCGLGYFKGVFSCWETMTSCVWRSDRGDDGDYNVGIRHLLAAVPSRYTVQRTSRWQSSPGAV